MILLLATTTNDIREL